MDSRELMAMGDVAERSGFAPSALRYYEAEGLIEATRSPGGRRLFQRAVLRRLAFIRAAANIGLTLDEIREELDRLPAGRTPTKADWQRISAHWRGRLDAQIARARAPARRPRLLHRLWLLLPPALPDHQPRGRHGRQRRTLRARWCCPRCCGGRTSSAVRGAERRPGRHTFWLLEAPIRMTSGHGQRPWLATASAAAFAASGSR